MMLRPVALALTLTLGACASPLPVDTGSQAAFERASEAAFRVTPRADAIPLPALDPPTRLQSQIARLTLAEVAAWILPPAEAAGIRAFDILTGHMPRPTAIVLYRAPEPSAMPGLCSVRGDDVWLRVPNENSLTYAQHLDPPLQPYQRQPFVRWKVAGSTLGAATSACASLTGDRDWFEASSEGDLFRAVNIIERAQTGALRPTLKCQQLAYEESRQGFATPACPDARAMLARLTPDLIRRVRPGDCEAASTQPCGRLAIEYHDPAAPRSHSLYVVTVPDEERPAWIEITQAMLPPM